MKRNEYPDPQFCRKNYTSLNGKWEFEIGDGKEKINSPLSETIEVPFCPESKLSGICKTEFIEKCVYSREIDIKADDITERLVLHFGAVNYRALVYVNGQFAVSHEGGYTPFEVDIAPFVKPGKNRITLLVKNDLNANVPSGKQSIALESGGCFYTRVTGIWQSVWLEKTPVNHILGVKFYPNINECKVTAELRTEGRGKIAVKVLYKGKKVGFGEGDSKYRCLIDIPLSEKHLWEVNKGELYDVEITFGKDIVTSYFGLREVEIRNGRFYLNNKSIFQRLALDQGYYPDGVYTPESIDEYIEDIELGKLLGFNGVRLHQKLSDPRLLFECDKAGYLVWGEYASWGMEYRDLNGFGNFIREWLEAMERDFNHPSIVIWSPLNETYTDFDYIRRSFTDFYRDRRFPEGVYAVTKINDPTRPCVDVSGGYHGRFTDVFDYHFYRDADMLAKQLQVLEEENRFVDGVVYPSCEIADCDAEYNGKDAIMLSEYGGAVLNSAKSTGWGYRSSDNEDEFVEEYEKLTKSILKCGKICGFCFTQLYDVEQEQNGLLTYERKHKLSASNQKRIAECNRMEAESEK